MRTHALLLGLPALALSGCLFRPDCSSDSAAADRMLLKIDHRERAGEYTYEFEARGTNTCTFTAPLGNAQPVCDLQGPSVKVRTDDKGITSFNATASAWDTEGSHWFRATRDGEVIYDSALDPNWGPHHGDGGCHLYDLGTVTVSF